MKDGQMAPSLIDYGRRNHHKRNSADTNVLAVFINECKERMRGYKGVLLWGKRRTVEAKAIFPLDRSRHHVIS